MPFLPTVSTPGFLPQGFIAALPNLALQSQVFTGAAWSPVDAVAVDNQTTAPDGTLTAAALTEDTTALAQHRLDQTIAFAARPYTFSIFAKPNGRSWINMRISGNGCYFDIQNGLVGSANGGVVGSIAAASFGFWRCTITFAPTAGSSAISVNLAGGDTVLNYTGDGASGAFIWGAQLR